MWYRRTYTWSDGLIRGGGFISEHENRNIEHKYHGGSVATLNFQEKVVKLNEERFLSDKKKF